ncbi:MAG: hypothetical protein GY868_01740, partial [Deltaproteobacteria bacterium]|nr:hypothetical protein [Deltaproteobacteria bacterium]
LSFPYTGPVKNLFTWRMFSPGMQSMQFGSGASEGAPIALSSDKEVLLQDLLEDVRCERVDLYPQTEFSDLVFQGDRVAVMAGEQTFSGTLAIAADGTNSRVVQKLGYNANRRHIANLYVRSCFVTGFQPPHADSIITGIVFIDAKPVYVFLLPRPDEEAWNFLVLTFEATVD